MGADYLFTPACQAFIVSSISNFVSIEIVLPISLGIVDTAYSDFYAVKILNLATGLPSPKHILTFMCNGQASPLALFS